jgi:hypothetical protein
MLWWAMGDGKWERAMMGWIETEMRCERTSAKCTMIGWAAN